MLLNHEFIFLRKDMTMSMTHGHSVNNLQVLMNLMKMKQWMTVKIFRRIENKRRNTEYIKILAKQVVKPFYVNIFWKGRPKEIGAQFLQHKFWNVFQNSFLLNMKSKSELQLNELVVQKWARETLQTLKKTLQYSQERNCVEVSFKV